MDTIVAQTMQALKRNHMGAHYVQTAADVVPLLETLLNEGDVVAMGGSVTLDQCNVLAHLRGGRYQLLDRYAPDLTREQVETLFRKAFFADAYLTSSNAITQDGALVNADGNANRVAAMAYGPTKVIVVAGVNKIVPDEAAALRRIESVAAPMNAKRLHCQTPCATTGTCAHCSGPGRICCTYVTHRQQRKDGRIQVILVNETLGY